MRNILQKTLLAFVATTTFTFSILPAEVNQSEYLEKTEVSREGLDTPQFLLARGLTLFFDHEWQQSKKYFKLHIEKFGDSELANRYLGQISILEGDLEKAKAYLLRGLQVSPNSTDILLLLGNIALQNRDESAIEYFEKVLQIDPYHEEAIFSLSELYLHVKKDRYRAMGLYKRLIVALQRNGGSSYKLMQLYNTLANYYTQKRDYKRAIVYFHKIDELSPNNINVLFSLGQLHKITGNLQESIGYMKKIQALNYKHRSSLYSMSESYYLLNKHLAKVYADAYLRSNGAAPLMKGISLETNDDPKAAKEIFENLIAKHKSGLTLLSSHVGKINILKEENDWQQIKIEAYQVIILAAQIQAYQVARDYSQIIFSILEKEKQQTSFDKNFFAKANIEKNIDAKILKIAVDSIEFYAAYGEILAYLDEPLGSLTYYQLSNRYIDRLETILQASPDILKKFEKEDVSLADSLQALKMKKYENSLKMGLLNGQLEMYPQAYQHFSTALKIFPENSRAHFLLGLVRYGHAEKTKNKKIYKDAYNSFEKSFRIADAKGEPSAEYYFYYGAMIEKNFDLDKAEPFLKKAIELSPDNPTYLNFLGYMYSVYDKNLEKAKTLLIRALDDDLENYAYLDSLGWIFYKQGDYQNALKNLLLAETYAEKKGAKDAVVYFHLAETYYQLKNLPLANLNYKKSLQMANDSSEELNVQYIEEMIAKTNNGDNNEKK